MIYSEIAKIVFSIGRLKNKLYQPLGTCTLINKPGNFITAAHVIDGNDDNLVIKINDYDFADYQDYEQSNFRLVATKIVSIDPVRDTCVLSIDNDVTSTINISDTDSVVPGEPVTVFGFPHSDTGRVILTQQTCEIGSKILLSNGGIKSKHIVLNIQTRPGQSGSPVIRNSDQSLIGFVVGAYVPGPAGIMLGNIDPQSLHQTTHAISTEYVQGMLLNDRYI